MESRVKTLGVVFAMTVCAMLVAGPGRAQEDVPQAASARDAPRREGAGNVSGSANKGADAKSNDSVGDRGANQSRPREGDAVRTGFPAPAAPGADASRKGTTAPAGGPGNQGVMLDNGINPIRLEGGMAGLQRRANRKMLIANAPKMPAGVLANTGTRPPSMHPGPDVGVMRNAVGMVVPGGGHGAGHAVSGYMAPAGIGASGLGTNITGTGAIGAGTAAGHVDGVDLHRPAIPNNAVAGAAAHAAGINGTTMGHIASGPGYIGGPAKDRSGINGSSIRPKQ